MQVSAVVIKVLRDSLFQFEEMLETRRKGPNLAWEDIARLVGRGLEWYHWHGRTWVVSFPPLLPIQKGSRSEEEGRLPPQRHIRRSSWKSSLGGAVWTVE
jgi:hypothetical protein